MDLSMENRLDLIELSSTDKFSDYLRPIITMTNNTRNIPKKNPQRKITQLRFWKIQYSLSDIDQPLDWQKRCKYSPLVRSKVEHEVGS
jgi:hypothetical protein